jgi:hypothetical protein
MVEEPRTLAELHAVYSGRQILAQVRTTFERDDGIGRLDDAELFLYVCRRTHCVGDWAEKVLEARQAANAAYLQFVESGYVELWMARCLLPGYQHPAST